MSARPKRTSKQIARYGQEEPVPKKATVPKKARAGSKRSKKVHPRLKEAPPIPSQIQRDEVNQRIVNQIYKSCIDAGLNPTEEVTIEKLKSLNLNFSIATREEGDSLPNLPTNSPENTELFRRSLVNDKIIQPNEDLNADELKLKFILYCIQLARNKTLPHFDVADADEEQNEHVAENQNELPDNQNELPDNQNELADNQNELADNQNELADNEDDLEGASGPSDSDSEESVIDTNEVSAITIEKPSLLPLDSRYGRMDEHAPKHFNVDCAAKFIDYLSFLMQKDSAEARIGSGTKDNTVPIALFSLGLTLAIVSAKISVDLDQQNEEEKSIGSLLDKWKNIGRSSKNVRNVQKFPWYSKISRFAQKVDRKLTHPLPSNYENIVEAFHFKFENKMRAITERQQKKGDQFEDDLKQYNPNLYSFLIECKIDYPSILNNHWSKRNPGKSFKYTLPPKVGVRNT